MSAAAPVTPERRRFAITMPPALWIGVAAVVLSGFRQTPMYA